MRVLCIDNVPSFIAPKVVITIGRCYDVIELDTLSYYFWLCDDNGYVTASMRSNFRSLDQVRDDRLCEIFGVD